MISSMYDYCAFGKWLRLEQRSERAGGRVRGKNISRTAGRKSWFFFLLQKEYINIYFFFYICRYHYNTTGSPLFSAALTAPRRNRCADNRGIKRRITKGVCEKRPVEDETQLIPGGECGGMDSRVYDERRGL